MLSAVDRLAGVAGAAATLCIIGAAIITFGRPALATVSDTVTHSVGRAFTVGFLAQIVVLPTAALIVAGLALTVIGLLLVPFAAVAAGLLVGSAVLYGLIAVAHAMGETLTRRRMARGVALSPNSYRYLLTGVSGLGVIWAGWIVFGWVPVAGMLILAMATLTTWWFATVGLGAAVLSRGGMRGEFAGRIFPPESLTDEYLWATPLGGVAAVKRPQGKQ
jgi:hypothetical protein